MNLPTITALGPDPDRTMNALTASVTGHYRAVTDGIADVVVIIGTTFLTEAADRATTAVVVLDPIFDDAARLAATPSCMPVLLSEHARNQLAPLGDGLRNDDSPAFGDVFTMSAVGSDPWQVLFSQVRLLRALHLPGTLEIDSLTMTATGFTAQAHSKATPLALLGATSPHQPGATTVALHRPERIDTFRIPDADTAAPLEGTVETPRGLDTYPARYDVAHRHTLMNLAALVEEERAIRDVSLFLADAATITLAQDTISTGFPQVRTS